MLVVIICYNTYVYAEDSDSDLGSLATQSTDYGQIIALNKVTANSKKIMLKIGKEKYFGNIKIKLHKCMKNTDPYNEDNYLLITVTEYKIDEDPNIIFQGWMSSSSISLSTFEHPIYEIFAKNCQ